MSVDAGGAITMPLIKAVPARGLTTAALARAVADRLRQGFVREPHVAIEVEAYRPFFILGEVTAPGQYAYVPHMTVEKAVAVAGGFTPRAYRWDIEIERPVAARRRAPGGAADRARAAGRHDRGQGALVLARISAIRWTASQTVGSLGCGPFDTMARVRRDVQIVAGLELAHLGLALEAQAGAAGQQHDPFGLSPGHTRNPGGLACPVETIRSMRTFGVVSSAVMSSSGPVCGSRANRFPFGGIVSH